MTTPEIIPLRSEAIFEPDGRRFVPTGLAAGPWYRGTQHGSAMLGLLARAIERHEGGESRQVTRLTVDLMRAAPMTPVETVARTHRRGKSVEVVEASLLADGREMARAVATRFRVHEVDVSSDGLPVPPAPQLPQTSDLRRLFGNDHRHDHDEEAFHHSLEMRPVEGFERPTLWLRSRVPLVAGEPLSPLERVAVASDFTYSVPFMAQMAARPHLLAQRPFVTINPDTSLNLHRPLRGEWVCLDGSAIYDRNGAGTALARLFDPEGAIGHSSQSILVRGAESRPERWEDPNAG